MKGLLHRMGFNRWSLVKKIAVPLNILTTILMVGLGSYLFLTHSQFYQRMLKEKIDATMQFLSGSGAVHMNNYDSQSLKTMVDQTLGDSDFVQIRFIDETQVDFVAGKNNRRYENHRVEKKKIVNGEGDSIGTLELTYSHDQMQKNLQHYKITLLSGIILIQMVLSLIIFGAVRQVSIPLRKTISDLEGNVRTLNIGSLDLSASSADVYNGCDNQSSAVHEMITSLQEFASLTFHTAERAKHSEQICQEMCEKVEQGRKTMDDVINFVSQMFKSMKRIKGETDNINALTQHHLENIVSVISGIEQKTFVINEIVQKTELLSFNAAIEAARAGQHGRGFAVVAHEVGILARMSGKASAEIQDLIARSGENVKKIVQDLETGAEQSRKEVIDGFKHSKNANAVTKEAFNLFGDINFLIADLNDKVAAVHESALEQKAGIGTINQAMESIDRTTSGLIEGAERTHDLSDQLKTQAKELNETRSMMDSIIFGKTGMDNAGINNAGINNAGIDNADIDNADIDDDGVTENDWAA